MCILIGEKIGLYFAFTGHYSTWLVPLCLASVAVILYFMVLYSMEGTLVDALSKGFMVPFFCIFVAVWAQLMLEYWKREQNRYLFKHHFLHVNVYVVCKVQSVCVIILHNVDQIC